MIPLLGHIAWYGPHLQPQEMIDSWSKVNPGIIWTLWRDHTGFENQAQIDARARRNEWNGVADLCRLEILHRFGGIFVDADSVAEKPLQEGDFFSQDTAIGSYESETVRPGLIACGMLGAPKGHPFFRACIDDAAKQNADEQAWKAVGPGLITRVALTMPDQIKVYPARMFCPTHFSGAKAPGDAPIFATQYFGSTKGYNSLRKQPCMCSLCWNNSLRSSWT